MIVTRALLALLFCKQDLYEENLRATMPIREKLWLQMDGIATRLLLKSRIGYPPPQMKVSGSLQLEKTGEDALATYYRTYLAVGDGLDAYGLYIVPKKLASKRTPLVVSQHGGGGFPEMATFHGGINYKDQVRGAVAQGYIVYAPGYPR